MFGRKYNTSSAGQAQQMGYCISKEETKTGSDTLSVSIQMYGNLVITKTDYNDTSTKLGGAQFVIVYKDSSGSYYWMSGTASGTKTYTTISKSYSTSRATTYTTSSSSGSLGTITLNKLSFGTYYIYEISTGSTDYYLEDQSDSTKTTRPSLKKVDSHTTWRYCGSKKVSSSHTTSSPQTITIKNKKSGNLTITKTDANIADTTISGAQFVLVYKDSSNNYYWVKGSESDKKTYTSVSTSYSTDIASVYTSDENGQITLNKLRLGTYYIYEIATGGEPYFLEDQESKSGAPSIKNIPDEWVYCGSKKVTTKNTEESPQTKTVTNIRRIKLSGYVWVDASYTKNETDDSSYDGEYDSENESLVEGVIVTVYDKTTGEQVASTTTSTSSGSEDDETSASTEYFFDYDAGLLYSELDNYYVKFEYAGEDITATYAERESGALTGETGTLDKNYITVAYNSSTESDIVSNGSRAMKDEVETKDEDLDGEATTYAGTNSDYESTYGLSGIMLNQLYNSNSNTLRYVNLGLRPIYEPDYSISEDLYYVKIIIDDEIHLYARYDEERMDLDQYEAAYNTSVKFQKSSATYMYTQTLYASDIQKMVADNNDDYIKMYVVYKIDIENLTSYESEYLYNEVSLCVKALQNTFDSDRYELYTDIDGKAVQFTRTDGDTEVTINEEDISSHFGNWSTETTSGTYTANLTGEGTQEVTTETTTYEKEALETIGATAITPDDNDTEEVENIVTTYIQFKVNSDAITEMLENYDEGINEAYPTTAKSTAYHNFTREDYSWKNTTKTSKVNNEAGPEDDKQTHQSKSEERENSAPYLVFTYEKDDDPPEDSGLTTRTISGYVFEDTVVTEGWEDDSGVEEEALGNGIYDTESENVVANCTVSLLSIDEDENETTAALYQIVYDDDGNIVEDEYGNISFDEDALNGEYSTYTTVEDGYFEFEGLLVGKYYLTFTYEDGTTKIMDSETGTLIDLNDYKSTIVTNEAARNALGYDDGEYECDYDEDEWYKYLNSDEEVTEWNIAVDDLDERSAYNNGYTTIWDSDANSYVGNSYDSEDNEITTMTANTATFKVTIENTQEDYSDGDYHEYDYEGFNFGIITQPEQSVEIEKLITNVKLVNDPTILIDGNPETSDEDGLTDLDGDSDNGGSTYTRVELEEDLIYGSELTITYSITVKNTSNLNYYEIDSEHVGDYCWYGVHDGEYSRVVQISIDEVIDCYDEQLQYTSGIENITNLTKDESTWKSEDGEYTDEEGVTPTLEDCIADQQYVYTYDGKDYTIAQALSIAELGTLSPGEESNQITFDCYKLLSTTDEDMWYLNTAGVKKATNTSDPDEDYDEDQKAAIITSLSYVKPVSIPEVAEAEITVTPPTGNNIWINIAIYGSATAMMLGILTICIAIIKRKVL